MCKNTGGWDPKSTMSMKIYHLLSNRNREGSNVQHLNAEFVDDEDDDLLTMKLVPKVLESTHNYSAQLYVIYGLAVPTLSIMYEILRGWKTPELFDTK